MNPSPTITGTAADRSTVASIPRQQENEEMLLLQSLVESNNAACDTLIEANRCGSGSCSYRCNHSSELIQKAVTEFRVVTSTSLRRYIEHPALQQQQPYHGGSILPTQSDSPTVATTDISSRMCRVGCIQASPMKIVPTTSFSTDPTINGRIHTSIVLYNLALALHHQVLTMEEVYQLQCMEENHHHRNHHQTRHQDQEQVCNSTTNSHDDNDDSVAPIDTPLNSTHGHHHHTTRQNMIRSTRDQCIALYEHARTLIGSIIHLTNQGNTTITTTYNDTVDVLLLSILNNLAIALFQKEEEEEQNDDGNTVQSFDCRRSANIHCSSPSSYGGEDILNEMVQFAYTVAYRQQCYRPTYHSFGQDFLLNASRLGAMHPKSAAAA